MDPFPHVSLPWGNCDLPPPWECDLSQYAEKNAGSASGGVVLKLRATDWLDHLHSTCRPKYGHPYLIFPAVCARILLKTGFGTHTNLK